MFLDIFGPHIIKVNLCFVWDLYKFYDFRDSGWFAERIDVNGASFKSPWKEFVVSPPIPRAYPIYIRG
jgi:hypothetical protein